MRLVLYGVAGVVLAASTVVTVMFRHDMGEARARLAAQPTEIFQSSYGDIEYRVSGTGPTVLVSHGITGGVDQAQALVTKWKNSSRTNTSSSSCLASATSAPTSRTEPRRGPRRPPIENCWITWASTASFVVGNSAGGTSAMWFAIDYPRRTNGLILISSAVPGPEPEYIPELVAKHDFVYWAAVKPPRTSFSEC